MPASRALLAAAPAAAADPPPPGTAIRQLPRGDRLAAASAAAALRPPRDFDRSRSRADNADVVGSSRSDGRRSGSNSRADSYGKRAWERSDGRSSSSSSSSASSSSSSSASSSSSISASSSSDSSSSRVVHATYSNAADADKAVDSVNNAEIEGATIAVDREESKTPSEFHAPLFHQTKQSRFEHRTACHAIHCPCYYETLA